MSHILYASLSDVLHKWIRLRLFPSAICQLQIIMWVCYLHCQAFCKSHTRNTSVIGSVVVLFSLGKFAILKLRNTIIFLLECYRQIKYRKSESIYWINAKIVSSYVFKQFLNLILSTILKLYLHYTNMLHYLKSN